MSMNNPKAIGLWALALVLLGGLLYWANSCYTNRQRKDAVLENKILTQEANTKVTEGHTKELGKQIDTVSHDVVHIIHHWDTVTAKIVLPGRVDSVFKDSAFAALPDSAKVEVLRLLGNQAAKRCSALVLVCQQFKDSAYKVFAQKDSSIDLWRQRYDNKPRRRCGPGVAGGVGGGLDGQLQPHTGAYLVLGYACTL